MSRWPFQGKRTTTVHYRSIYSFLPAGHFEWLPKNMSKWVLKLRNCYRIWMRFEMQNRYFWSFFHLKKKDRNEISLWPQKMIWSFLLEIRFCLCVLYSFKVAEVSKTYLRVAGFPQGLWRDPPFPPNQLSFLASEPRCLKRERRNSWIASGDKSHLVLTQRVTTGDQGDLSFVTRVKSYESTMVKHPGSQKWLNWVFPRIGIPQDGWFIMKNPIKMGWFGVFPPIFGNTHIKTVIRPLSVFFLKANSWENCTAMNPWICPSKIVSSKILRLQWCQWLPPEAYPAAWDLSEAATWRWGGWWLVVFLGGLKGIQNQVMSSEKTEGPWLCRVI